MNESYLDAARRGKHSLWRYVLGLVFVLFMWFGVGFLATVGVGAMLGVDAARITSETSGAGLIRAYLVTNASFIPFLLGPIIAVALIHRRSPLTLITGRRSIDWRRVGTGLGLWFGLLAVANIVSFLITPSSFSLGPNLLAFIPFAVMAIILTPLQTTAEEVFFRGYVVQGASVFSGNFLFLAATSGLLFMIPHLANPELSTSFIPVVLFYFGFGAFMAYISLKDGSIELSIGAHAANNLFVAIFVSYAGGALNTPSLFRTLTLNPWLDFVSFVVFSAVFYYAVFFVFKRRNPATRSVA